MSVLRGEAVWGFGLAFLLAPGALQCDLAVGTELQFELNEFTFDMARRDTAGDEADAELSVAL